jgi:integrase
VHFHELTTELLREYELFLLSFRVKNNKGGDKFLSYGRIHCLFKTLRAYVNRAIQEGYMEAPSDPFRRFSTAKYRKVASQTTRKYLTPEELRAIESLEIPEHLNYLEKIRDMFLMSCYTGLRYSDIVRLDRSCLQFTKGEGYSLYYSMQYKTKTDVLVPVYLLFNRKPELIVKKYLNYLGQGEKLFFDEISNQYMNRCLKQLAFLAGIENNLTFHMARHSCATLLLDMGLSYEVVQQILGQTIIRTTQIYGKVRKEAVKKALKGVKWDDMK